MRPPIIVKSFGFGIYSVRCDQPLSVETICERTGIPVTELISDGQNSYVIASTGHEPSKYELSNIELEEWENVRTVVDAKGSKIFSERLTMLEAYKL
jgi:hypothetical protein